MKNPKIPKNNDTVQGSSTADRAHHHIKIDIKENGISNAGGQLSD